jgi:hypothetical protein
MLELFTFAGVLAFGSLAFWSFWIVAIAAMFVLIALAENEHWVWATVLLVAAFFGIGTLGIFNLYAYTVDHPWSLLGRAAAYVGIGCVWGAFKWWRYCKKQRGLYDEAKKDFLDANKATEMTPELRVLWTEKLQNSSRYDRYHVIGIPEASNNKEKIMNWMYLWPFSILGTFFYDFLKEIGEAIYDWMGGIYDNIAKSVWKGTENDLASEDDKRIAAEKKNPDSIEEQVRRNRR